MGNLWGIIQEHLDEMLVTEAKFAMRIGTGAQTVNSWKKRGIKKLPAQDLLAAVARETGADYMAVLAAALHDSGYLPEPQARPRRGRSGGSGDAAPIAPERTTGQTVTPPGDLAAAARRLRESDRESGRDGR